LKLNDDDDDDDILQLGSHHESPRMNNYCSACLV